MLITHSLRDYTSLGDPWFVNRINQILDRLELQNIFQSGCSGILLTSFELFDTVLMVMVCDDNAFVVVVVVGSRLKTSKMGSGAYGKGKQQWDNYYRQKGKVKGKFDKGKSKGGKGGGKEEDPPQNQEIDKEKDEEDPPKNADKPKKDASKKKKPKRTRFGAPKDSTYEPPIADVDVSLVTEPGRLGIYLNPLVIMEGLIYGLDSARDCQRSDKIPFYPLLLGINDMTTQQVMQSLSMCDRQYTKMVGSNIQIDNPQDLIAAVRTGMESALLTNVTAPVLSRSVGALSMENGENLESVGIPFHPLIADAAPGAGEVSTDPAQAQLRYDVTGGEIPIAYLAYGIPNIVLATFMKAVLESGLPNRCQTFNDVINVVTLTHFPFMMRFNPNIVNLFHLFEPFRPAFERATTPSQDAYLASVRDELAQGDFWTNLYDSRVGQNMGLIYANLWNGLVKRGVEKKDLMECA